MLGLPPCFDLVPPAWPACAPPSPADGEYVAAACESGGLLVQLWEAECELRLNAVLEGRGSTRWAAPDGLGTPGA